MYLVSYLMPSSDGFNIFILVVRVLFTGQFSLYVTHIHLECILIQAELQLQKQNINLIGDLEPTEIGLSAHQM